MRTKHAFKPTLNEQLETRDVPSAFHGLHAQGARFNSRFGANARTPFNAFASGNGFSFGNGLNSNNNNGFTSGLFGSNGNLFAIPGQQTRGFGFGHNNFASPAVNFGANSSFGNSQFGGLTNGTAGGTPFVLR